MNAVTAALPIPRVRRVLSQLAMAVVTAGLIATPSAGVAIAENPGDSSGGGGGGGSSQSSNNDAWPPTDVYWPPAGGTSSSDGAGDGSAIPSVLPTPIVIPGGPPIVPDDGHTGR